MEFISMPLSKLRSKPTTCVSSYDMKELNIEMKAENPGMKRARIQ
jgi:hypothetical protein